MRSKKDLIPIRVKTLKPDFGLTFNIYFRMKSKDLLYFKEGIGFSKEHLESLFERRVKKLHILKSDEDNYQLYLDNYLSELSSSQDISDEKKADVVKAACEDNVEVLLERPSSNEAYNKAKKTSEILNKTIKSSDSILVKLLKNDDSGSDKKEKIKKHLLDSSSIVLKFCDTLDIDEAMAETLSTAALYQDISFETFGEKEQLLFFKSFEQMNHSEKIEYFSHPEKSSEIARDIKVVDSSFLDYVKNHEEKLDGQGFPNKLRKLSKEQQILNLCCLFSHEVNCLGRSLVETTQDFNIKQVGKFDLELINKFVEFLSLQKFD